MTIFIYDKTFEGLLTAVFDAYSFKLFPDRLQAETEQLPLFYEHVITIGTDEEKANRVWKGLKKKLSPSALSMLTSCWLSELPEIGTLLFRYIRKAIDCPKSIELNFGDADVLELAQIWKKVGHERERILMFARFQKTIDNIYFAPVEPLYNVIALVTDHFKDRFADQQWILYDMKRQYGYYYDLKTITEIHFEKQPPQLRADASNQDLWAEEEKLFQTLWKTYFKTVAIKERTNPKLHRQNLPVRFWKYLTEKKK